jgi:hypothetical protein
VEEEEDETIFLDITGGSPDIVLLSEAAPLLLQV